MTVEIRHESHNSQDVHPGRWTLLAFLLAGGLGGSVCVLFFELLGRYTYGCWIDLPSLLAFALGFTVCGCIGAWLIMNNRLAEQDARQRVKRELRLPPDVAVRPGLVETRRTRTSSQHRVATVELTASQWGTWLRAIGDDGVMPNRDRIKALNRTLPDEDKIPHSFYDGFEDTRRRLLNGGIIDEQDRLTAAGARRIAAVVAPGPARLVNR